MEVITAHGRLNDRDIRDRHAAWIGLEGRRRLFRSVGLAVVVDRLRVRSDVEDERHVRPLVRRNDCVALAIVPKESEEQNVITTGLVHRQMQALVRRRQRTNADNAVLLEVRKGSRIDPGGEGEARLRDVDGRRGERLIGVRSAEQRLAGVTGRVGGSVGCSGRRVGDVVEHIVVESPSSEQVGRRDPELTLAG